MDIASGLTLLGQATGIVKTLREIDKSFDLANVKAQMAELYVTLADVKMSLSDAREELHNRDQEIRDLRKRVADLTSGSACPRCEAGRLKVTSVRPDPMFGKVGLQQHTLKCDACDHSEKRQIDPSAP